MYKITAGGCQANHPANFQMNRPVGIQEHLLLLVHTKAEFQIEDKTFTVFPGEMVLIRANTPYHYHPLEGHYVDDWFHFLADPSEDQELEGLFNKNISFANPSRVANYLLQLLWEFTEKSQDNCQLLLTLIFNHARAAVENQKTGQGYSPYLARMQELRLRLLSDPTGPVDVEKISKDLGISVSYFEHLYRDFFHTSFRKDFISMRINYAKELLSGTPDTLETIAHICGYQNQVHFHRQFKKITGITPTTYRQMAAEALATGVAVAEAEE